MRLIPVVPRIPYSQKKKNVHLPFLAKGYDGEECVSFARAELLRAKSILMAGCSHSSMHMEFMSVLQFMSSIPFRVEVSYNL